MNALKQRWQSGCLGKAMIVGGVVFLCMVCGFWATVYQALKSDPVGEVRATGQVTPKPLPRVTVTPEPATEVAVVAATAAPLSPTNTPRPTDTPEPPTNTPRPTDTPEPTSTPQPTNTPIPPTRTPLPTDTPEPKTAALPISSYEVEGQLIGYGFDFDFGQADDGTMTRVGTSANELGLVELIGLGNEMKAITVVLGMASDNPEASAENIIYVLALTETLIPGWDGANDWMVSQMEATVTAGGTHTAHIEQDGIGLTYSAIPGFVTMIFAPAEP